jgi:hypothetical protein
VAPLAPIDAVTVAADGGEADKSDTAEEEAGTESSSASGVDFEFARVRHNPL